MLRPRIIPCLLVHEGGLIKTASFKEPKYVGDPLNAVKIFNEKEADELIVLDIDATKQGKEPNYKMIANLASECRMPLCYGGGIKTVEQAKYIISLGVEKIAISSAAIQNVSIVSEIAEAIGRQSVVVVLDAYKKTGFFGKGYEVRSHNATQSHKLDPIELALEMQEAGAGEIVVNSINNDGQMQGYDYELALRLYTRLRVPLTMLGGAGSLGDMQKLIEQCGVIGVAAGSLFVFKGKYRAVLINYPTSKQKDEICFRGLS